MHTSEIRAAVRAAYNQRCGYCGVSEIWVGGELEIDHFRPLSQGGADDPSNLVYACTTCNRFKSDYWQPSNAPASLRLLHPAQDDFNTHIVETMDGQLIGLTPRGWFHIERLHLNRVQLVAMRQLRQTENTLRAEIAQAEAIKIRLQARIRELETELNELQRIIAQLSG